MAALTNAQFASMVIVALVVLIILMYLLFRNSVFTFSFALVMAYVGISVIFADYMKDRVSSAPGSQRRSGM